MKTFSSENVHNRVNLPESFIESAKGRPFICDRTGTFIGGNDAMSRLSGYSRNEYIDQNILTLGLKSPDHISRVLQMFDDVFEYASAGPENVGMQLKDRSLLDVEAERRVVTLDGQRFLVGTLLPVPYPDIKIEGSIEESIGAKSFFDMSGITMVSLDKKGNITLVNDNSCRVPGYEENHLPGSNWFDNFLSDKIRKQIKSEIENKSGPGDGSDGLPEPSETTRIPLVEDNPVNLKLAKLILTRENYIVETAGNGQEAVNKYTSALQETDS